MRIDKELCPQFGSRTKAAEAVERGWVLVNGKTVTPSYNLKEGDKITYIRPEESFVSNGGYKLSKALKDFDFSPEGMTFIDVGASNGGFTDCLFKNGAKKVYCIDVGESQLDDVLKSKNVVIMDNFNARNLKREHFTEKIDGAVIDVSFISLTYILKEVADVLEDGGKVIALIKPQFECDKKSLGKSGIVKDPTLRKRAVEKIYNYCIECNLTPQELTVAPIRQNKNVEFLLLCEKNAKNLNTQLLNKYAKF